MRLDPRATLPLVLLLAYAAPAAAALQLSNITAAKTGINYPDMSSTSGQERDERASEVSIQSGVTATHFSTRYAFVNAIDVSAGTTDDGLNEFHSNYDVTFQVSALADEGWVLDLSTRVHGALTLVNDGGKSASAEFKTITSTLTGASWSSGNLDTPYLGYIEDNHGENTDLDVTENATIRGVGPASITLNFDWFTLVRSYVNVFVGGDEAAVRMGLASDIAHVSAGDYPGVGSRTRLNDGHFVTVDLRPDPDYCQILRYTFEGQDPGFDKTGNGHKGYIGGLATLGGGVDGGTGIYFDPNNNSDELYTLDKPDLRITGDMTGMAWIYPEGDHSDTHTPGCTQGTIFAKGGAIWFQIEQQNNGITFQNEGSGAPGTVATATVNPPISTNAWHHVAFVRRYNASTLRWDITFYLDGSNIGTRSISAAPAYTMSKLDFGNYGFNGPGECEFNGGMDEIRIFCRPLSDEEVLARFLKPSFKRRFPEDASGGSERDRLHFGDPVGAAPPVQLSTTGDGRIHYQLKLDESGPVEARVFDVAGRLVGTLLTDQREAGTSRGELDMRALTPAPASGLYFVRMRTPQGNATIRVAVTH